MDVDLIKSLALIAGGAAITFLVDYLRGISARKKEKRDREELRREVRRLEGRTHTERVLRALDHCWSALQDAQDADGIPLPKKESSRIYSSYLLIPDAEIRVVVQNAMYGANNFNALGADAPSSEEFRGTKALQMQYIFAARASVAAYLRGDRPEDSSIGILREVSAHLDQRFGLA